MKFMLAEKFPEADETVTTFVWQPESPVNWTAGKYLKYTLPHDNPDDRGITRFFTIAAAPFEKRPRITTRFTESNGSTFKTRLHSLKIGVTIEASNPMGDFIFDTTRPVVMLAGGIGITPYRAMLLQLAHEGINFQVHLLYANRTDKYVFKDQLEKIAAENQNFKISYFTDPKHIELVDIQDAAAQFSNPMYYLSGPEPMVDHYNIMLKDAGIREEAIKLDDFPGYEKI